MWNSADNHIAAGECLEIAGQEYLLIKKPTHTEVEDELGMSLTNDEVSECLEQIEKALEDHVKDEVRFWQEIRYESLRVAQ